MLTYPVNLVGLEKRLCLVAGGGVVALRKVEGLRAAGARVRVVAPVVEPELAQLAAEASIEVVARGFEPEDLDGVFLAIIAMDDRGVNRAAAQAAMARGCLVNVVDDPDASNFIVPAVVRRGELTVAVSTGGASPALARRLREELETRFGPEYEGLVEILAALRPEIIARFASGRPRLDAALRLVDADLPAVLREQGRDAALEHARRLLDGG